MVKTLQLKKNDRNRRIVKLLSSKSDNVKSKTRHLSKIFDVHLGNDITST